MAESQLLIPKSFKEKQAKAARRRYRKTVIRIQFPDGVVLQGIFNPWERTSSLYEVSPFCYFLFDVVIFPFLFGSVIAMQTVTSYQIVLPVGSVPYLVTGINC